METMTDEKIDKLFDILESFYGERWSKHFHKPHVKSFYKTIWKNGLMYVTHEEIKNALIYCKRAAQSDYASPPNIVEFYNYCKGLCQPFIDYSPKPEQPINREAAHAHIQRIKQMIRGGCAENYAKLSA